MAQRRLHGTALLLGSFLSFAYACGGGDDTVTTLPSSKKAGGTGGTTGKGVPGGSVAKGGSAPGGGTTSGGSPASGGASAGGTTGNGGTTGTGAGGNGLPVPPDGFTLSVDPPSAVLDITDGKAKSQPFKAIAKQKNGSSAPVSASWSIDPLDLGKLDNNGLFTSAGIVGGVAKVTATVSNATATASIKVNVKVSGNGQTGGKTPLDPVAPGDQKKLEDGEASGGNPAGPTGKILYPYDATVFARGLVAPEIMWDGGAAGDSVLIHLAGDYYDAKLFFKADAPGRYLMPAKVWSAVADSNRGEPLRVTITRMSAAGVVGVPMKAMWTVAQGNLRGTIYYWAVSNGQIMKIGPGKESPDPVFDSGSPSELGTPSPKGAPPNATWDGSSNQRRCVACHTVSKDGSTLVSDFSSTASLGSRPWGAVDLKQTDAAGLAKIVSFSDSTINALGVSLTPTGTHVVANTAADQALRFFDRKTGLQLPSELSAFTDHLADPMFAPDGKSLSFVGNIQSPGWKLSGRSSSLNVISYDPATLKFGFRKTILPATPGIAIAYPTFSPDSQWLLYQRGNCMSHLYCDGQPIGTPGKLIGRDDIYLVNAAGGQEVPLDLANGVGYLADRNLHTSFEPRVNPIAVGGYMWYIFVSVRDYGNKMVAKSDPATQNHKQLWVAAVDLTPSPGKDPSHPPFLLRGQDEISHNMSGYWTLDPCRSEGKDCASGTQCCTGFCRPDGDGDPVCVKPPGSDTPGTMGEAGAGGAAGAGSGKGGASGAGSGKGGSSGSGTGGASGGTGTGQPGDGSSCSRIEEKCTISSDCCGAPSIKCIGGFCALPAPG